MTLRPHLAMGLPFRGSEKRLISYETSQFSSGPSLREGTVKIMSSV